MIVEKFPPVERVRYISLEIQMMHLIFFAIICGNNFKIFPGVNYISRVFQGYFQGQLLFQGYSGSSRVCWPPYIGINVWNYKVFLRNYSVQSISINL